MFAIAVGLGVTGMIAGTTLTAPIALAQGANEHGPYDPTPSAGDNQGNGNAPDNGTVGNADDKNPPGQQPGGNDNNHGYECDGNHGVGDNGGNPAHTGCENQPDNGGDNPGGGNPGGGGEVEASNLEQLPATPATPESAAPAAEVMAETLTAAAAPAPAPAQLPFTGPGSLTTALAIAGALMVLFGFVLLGATKEPKRTRPVYVA